MNDLILTLILPLARYSSPGEALFCGALTAILFGVISCIAHAIKNHKNRDNK